MKKEFDRIQLSPKPLPPAYHTVTPFLIVSGASNAIDFYRRAFGASELSRLPASGGKVRHAEIRIGNSPVMLADEFPELGYRSPSSLGGSPVSIFLYVDNVDATAEQALSAGAIMLTTGADQSNGDRVETLADPFGHIWTLAARKVGSSPRDPQQSMIEAVN